MNRENPSARALTTLACLVLLVGCRPTPAPSSAAPAPAPATVAPPSSGDGESLNTAYDPTLTGPHPLVGMLSSLKSTPRAELMGMHPRVFVTEEGLGALRARARTTHREMWQGVLKNMRALREEPPAPPAQARRVQNDVGLGMAEAALAYKVEGDAKYLAAAKKYMDAAVAYDVWGYTYNKPNVDLAAGHLLYGLGWAYDLLYNDLSAAERKTYRDKLVKQANLVYEFYAPKAGRTYSYSQNHTYIPMAGLAVAAYALYGEVPEAAQWAQLTRAIMGRVLDTFSEDGYFYEGFEYWVFSMPWLLQYVEAHRHVTGEDLFDRPGFRNAHLYLAHVVLPDGKHVFDFGDVFHGATTRAGKGDDYPRTHPGGKLVSSYNLLYLLAARFKDPEIQAVANHLQKLGHKTFFDYASLLWYDASITPSSIEALPTSHYFVDHEVVFYRTDWSPGATALAFKCGPPEGHAAAAKIKKYPDWHLESGHAHPDANSFILFARGQYLTGDSGYAGVPMTDQHNTLLVNGKGQAKEGTGHNAFDGVSYDRLNELKLQVVALDKGKFKVIGHGAPAYEPGLGLTRFERELTLVSPTELRIVDRVTAEQAATFTTLVHSDGPIKREANNRFSTKRGDATLQIRLQSPTGLAGAVEPNVLIGPGQPGSVSKGEREERGTRLRISNSAPATEAELETVLQVH